MGVPSCLSGDEVALHCFVAAEYVFKCAGEDVVYAGFSIGGGWSFIEVKTLFVCVFFYGFLKGVICFPLCECFLCYLGEVKEFV